MWVINYYLKVTSRTLYSAMKWSNIPPIPVLGICIRKFAFQTKYLPVLTTKSLIPTQNLVSKSYSNSDNPYDVTDEPKKNHPFKCDICDKSFSSKSNLKHHIDTIHLKLKSYKCEECGKTFNQKGNLEYHVKTVHLKIKPYKCEECCKTFGSKQDLKRHIDAVHLKIKPFKCDECGISFATEGNLKTHINQVHHPYKCKYCEELFDDQDSLYGHVSLVHKNFNDDSILTKSLPWDEPKLTWEELDETWENVNRMERVKNRDIETKIEVMKYFLLKKRKFHSKFEGYGFSFLDVILKGFRRIENFEENNEKITGYLLSPEEKNFIKNYWIQTYDPEFNDTVCLVCKKDFYNLRILQLHIEKVHLNIDRKLRGNYNKTD